jgi:hypothetical protein
MVTHQQAGAGQLHGPETFAHVQPGTKWQKGWPCSGQNSGGFQRAGRLLRFRRDSVGSGQRSGAGACPPNTVAASKSRLDVSKLPFDPRAFIRNVPGWDGVKFDQTY